MYNIVTCKIIFKSIYTNSSLPFKIAQFLHITLYLFTNHKNKTILSEINIHFKKRIKIIKFKIYIIQQNLYIDKPPTQKIGAISY